MDSIIQNLGKNRNILILYRLLQIVINCYKSLQTLIPLFLLKFSHILYFQATIELWVQFKLFWLGLNYLQLKIKYSKIFIFY